MTFDEYMENYRGFLESRRLMLNFTDTDIGHMMEHHRILWALMKRLSEMLEKGQIEQATEVCRLINTGKLDEAERLAVGE